ncbi:MAG: hypothetical protein ACYC2T_11470 [Bacillota bacterium]
MIVKTVGFLNQDPIMLKNLLGAMKVFLQDQRGALTTLEIIGYTVLIGGAVALVGFGATILARGKLGATTKSLTNVKAISKPVTNLSDYQYGTVTTDTATGMVTGVTPTN